MAAAERKYILVVDDESDIRRYLTAILVDAGYEVASAGDGDTALAMVRERVPDLISLDLVMPGKSGAKFLYALRKNREWSRIPVIIVTGHAHDEKGRADLEDIFAGRAISGPETCLEKPVTPASYVSAVRRHLGLTREEKPAPVKAPVTDVKEELERELAGADPETMRRVLEMLRGKDTRSARAITPGARRILIIDDEPDVSSYLSALLEDRGYVTTTANDADEGLRLARTDPPDLVTLDVDMPGKSGVQVYKEMKGDAVLRGVPVVVITGIQQDLKPLFYDRGPIPDVEGYITKPFDPELLYETVERAMGGGTA